jgi:hypothetical protein
MIILPIRHLLQSGFCHLGIVSRIRRRRERKKERKKERKRVREREREICHQSEKLCASSPSDLDP